jgi:lysophospholipase L1-like esterase
MLEQELNKKEPGRCTVTNAGVYGYTSFQGVRRFNEALQYQPDMVIVSFGCNDGMRVTVSDAAFASRPIRKNRLDTVLYKTHTGQLLLACSDKLFTSGSASLVPRVSVEEYKNNLNEMICVGRERGIKVVLLTRPFTDIEGETHDENWWKNFAPDYNAATKEVGAANGLTVVDIAGYFADKKGMFADESHFTKEGFQLAAKLIHDAIRPLITNPGAKPEGR